MGRDYPRLRARVAVAATKCGKLRRNAGSADGAQARGARLNNVPSGDSKAYFKDMRSVPVSFGLVF